MLTETFSWVLAGRKDGRWGVSKRFTYLANEPLILSFQLVIFSAILLVVGVFTYLVVSPSSSVKYFLCSFPLIIAAISTRHGTSVADDLLEKPQNSQLKGGLAVVTGANSGLGKQTAAQLAAWGCDVIIGCRESTKTRDALKWLNDQNADTLKKGSIELICVDFSDLASVRSFADGVLAKKRDIHLLVNNAGLMTPQKLTRTKQGHEVQFGVNHLAHFLLTNLLVDNISRCGGRVVNVASLGHILGSFSEKTVAEVTEKNYDPVVYYAVSKDCNIRFARELNRRLDRKSEASAQSATAYSLHPGAVRTDLARHGRNLPSLVDYLMKTAWEGSQTTLVLCASATQDLHPGGYYSDCVPIEAAPTSRGADTDKALWDYSEKLVKDFMSG